MTEQTRVNEPRNYPPRNFTPHTVLKFGKYKNKTCLEVYQEGEDGQGYLQWMTLNFHNDTFSADFYAMLNGEEIPEFDDEDDIPF